MKKMEGMFDEVVRYVATQQHAQGWREGRGVF
jgi:hypothetical protein